MTAGADYASLERCACRATGLGPCSAAHSDCRRSRLRPRPSDVLLATGRRERGISLHSFAVRAPDFYYMPCYRHDLVSLYLRRALAAPTTSEHCTAHRPTSF